MRKMSITSITCASVLFGMTAMMSPVYADTQSDGSHAQRTDGLSKAVDSQNHVTQNQVHVSHDNGSGQSTTDNSTGNQRATTDMQTIITQFEQAIKKYQDVNPKDGPSAKLAKGHRHPSKDSAGSSTDSVTNKTKLPLPADQFNSTNNTDNTPSQNSTGDVYGLNEEGNLVNTNNTANSAATDNNAVNNDSSNNTSSSDSSSGTSSSLQSSNTTNAQGNTNQDSVSPAIHAGQAVTDLKSELAKYQSATTQDKAAQTSFTQAVQDYIQALHDAASASNAGLLSAHQQDASNALQDVQSALADQNQVHTLLTALKKAGTQLDISNMTTILAKMVTLETDKVSDLQHADTLLSNAATDIETTLTN